MLSSQHRKSQHIVAGTTLVLRPLAVTTLALTLMPFLADQKGQLLSWDGGRGDTGEAPQSLLPVDSRCVSHWPHPLATSQTVH